MTSATTAKAINSALSAITEAKQAVGNNETSVVLASLNTAEAAINKATAEIEELKQGIARSHIRQIIMQDMGISRDEIAAMATTVIHESVTKAVTQIVKDELFLRGVVHQRIEAIYKSEIRNGDTLTTLIQRTVGKAAKEYMAENFAFELKNVKIPTPSAE
jgi:uncharacterized protein YejL (UPF0352 family)